MKRLIIALSLLMSLCCGASFAQDAKGYYTIGVVPQFEVRRLHSIWRPILDHIEEDTGYRLELRGSLSIPDFEKEFSKGTFDFAYMNPYHMVVANDQAGYVPLVRDTGRELFGVLVVKSDSGIDSPKMLDGMKVAFPAPNALGASLQMRQELHDLFDIDITPVYVKTHDSVYLNVLLGKTTAGGGVQKTLAQQKAEHRESLRVIHETRRVAPHPFAAHPRVPEEVIDAVTASMLRLGESEEGRALLAKVPIKQVGEASMDDYLPLKSMGLERYYVTH